MRRHAFALCLATGLVALTGGCDVKSAEQPAAVDTPEAVTEPNTPLPAEEVRPAPAIEQAAASYPEPCRAAGEGRLASAMPDRCGGIWNVYASIPDGYVWNDDKMGADPAAQRITRQATQLQSSLRDCGITAEVSLSDFFDDFTPGLVVVHSHPHATNAAANAELAQARACGLSGYSKQSLLQIAGRD